MLSNLRKAIVRGLLLVFIAILLPAIQPVQAGGQLIEPTPPTQLYLPLITKPPVYLTGQVTYKGAPVAGQTLILRFFDGAAYSTSATAITDASGDYQFELNQWLLTGQSMYIRWDNADNNDAWLSSYICNAILENPVDDVNCSFDIENINLAATTPYITLPYTFSWTKRSTPSDSYFFKMYKLNFGSPFFTSASLGYVDSYLLDGLPAGYMANTPYVWYVRLCDANGCGLSYQEQDIIFTDASTFPP